MRKPLALVVLLAGALFVLRRRRAGGVEHVSLYYADGSSITLQRGTPGVERVLALARNAL
jgi:hypothetical protein